MGLVLGLRPIQKFKELLEADFAAALFQDVNHHQVLGRYRRADNVDIRIAQLRNRQLVGVLSVISNELLDIAQRFKAQSLENLQVM